MSHRGPLEKNVSCWSCLPNQPKAKFVMIFMYLFCLHLQKSRNLAKIFDKKFEYFYLVKLDRPWININKNPLYIFLTAYHWTQFDNSKCHKLLLSVYKFLWEVANLKTLIALVTQLMLYAIFVHSMYFFEVISNTT